MQSRDIGRCKLVRGLLSSGPVFSWVLLASVFSLYTRLCFWFVMTGKN